MQQQQQQQHWRWQPARGIPHLRELDRDKCSCNMCAKPAISTSRVCFLSSCLPAEATCLVAAFLRKVTYRVTPLWLGVTYWVAAFLLGVTCWVAAFLLGVTASSALRFLPASTGSLAAAFCVHVAAPC